MYVIVECEGFDWFECIFDCDVIFWCLDINFVRIFVNLGVVIGYF